MASPSATPAQDGVKQVLSGLRRTATACRYYRVNVAVTALGIPFFRRSEVGGGFASVETGSGGGVSGVGLQFAAGSWPERSAGLNRFGMFREASVEHESGHRERAFSGFITTSKEESLSEARTALKTGGGTPLAVAWGGARGDAGWFHSKTLEVSLTRNWKDADAVLVELLRQAVGVPSHPAPGSTSTFLTAMRNAALSAQTAGTTPFLHNGKRYELHTRWRSTQGGELEGRIQNSAGEVTAEFRTFYEPGDTTGLPVRIEYHARSYLRLTFESHPGGAKPIPTLFPSE